MITIFSKALIETLREEPKDAELKSHKILLRAGFIKQHSSGIHTYLPLGWRVLLKIANIIREEMDRIGSQELLMPALSPREIWEESGRWRDFGDDMFRLKDRKGRDYCLCPTHEEVITEIARNHIRSYRDLPQIWYQIQTKFRDEPRPRGGVIRSRQFLMKDSYSLDLDEDGLDKSFNLHKEAYSRIFTRCGLKFVIVDASGGLMGTGESKEFMAVVDGGEDTVVLCPNCDYRSNLDVAEGIGEYVSFPEENLKKVATPNKRTVEEVSQFLNVKPSNLIKNMFLTAQGREPVLILIRGDYEINEERLKKIIGSDYQPASPEEIQKYFGAEPGFIGPVGIENIKIIADDLLKDVKGMVTGANENDFHLKGVDIKRDVKVKDFYNIRQIKSGDRCIKCGAVLEIKSALELGHIFKLGTKYSASMGAYYLDQAGREKPIVMGSYGIGLERIMACAVEQWGDEKGAVWPISIAPFDIYVLILNPQDKDIQKAGTQITRELNQANFSIILDDRDVSAGIKFNDADLIGIPLRITIGPKGIKQNQFDIYVRANDEKIECSKENLVETCLKLKNDLMEKLNA
jgi:prolyl-tRNA synthetase|uniref:Proline--tRNA ligase n=1 Tax=candidate division WOR-3 bacterium TaxID=2052148 RepID=A0A7V3VTL9_UNCW3